MKDILDYLKKSGESPTTEISSATGIPLNELHQHLTELQASNQIMCCNVTRFDEDKKAEVMICRLVGHGPAVKPVKKAKPLSRL
jgi:hypothetical protein